MMRVYSAADLPGAHMVLHLLREAGIEAVVFNENAQGGLGEIPFVHVWPEVWVMDDRDASRAREIIRVIEQIDTTAQKCCGACGEVNPGNFQCCWRCGESIS